MAKISICIPIYQMENATQLLARNLESILFQTYKDYEIIVSDDSDSDELKTFLQRYPVKYYKNMGPKGMANNTNYAISRARGEIIKILFQDDYFYGKDSLADIIRHFTPTYYWLVTACSHDIGGQQINPHYPYYSDSENTIGSPSVMAFTRGMQERFDPRFSWVLDLDLYRRIRKRYGKPKIVNKINVVIGIGEHQTTFKLSEAEKLKEHQQLYDTSPKTNIR